VGSGDKGHVGGQALGSQCALRHAMVSLRLLPQGSCGGGLVPSDAMLEAVGPLRGGAEWEVCRLLGASFLYKVACLGILWW
jgi:hypothetical protein